jgi:hypothetical protein
LIPVAARKLAKRAIGYRSSRYITDKLGEPVRLFVDVIDDNGFNALTALREGVDLKPFKERFKRVHARLHTLPYWIADPVKLILGHWARTIRRAQHAVRFTLREDELWFSTQCVESGSTG